jgi:S1-C subfamily serine protease
MRSRKLDKATAEQTDEVLSLASAAVGIGWALVIFTVGIAVIGGVTALGYQDGSKRAIAALIVISSVGVWGSLGLALVLLGHSSRLNALAVKGNLIDIGVWAPVPRGRFATSRFGATLVADPIGARVIDVDPDGGAERSGLVADDVIVAMADLEPLTLTSISEFIRTSPPGTRVDLTYLRGSDEITVELNLG